MDSLPKVDLLHYFNQAAQAQIKKAFKDFRQSHPLDSRFKTLKKAAYDPNDDNTVINQNPPDLVLSVVDSTPNDDYTLDGNLSNCNHATGAITG